VKTEQGLVGIVILPSFKDCLKNNPAVPFSSSVENRVTPITQAVFYHELSFLPGGSGTACHARHRSDTRAFAGRVRIAHDGADRATHDCPAYRATDRLAAHLLRDFLALRQIFLVPAHVYPSGIDHDIGAATSTGGDGDKAHKNEGISDSFHDGLPNMDYLLMNVGQQLNRFQELAALA
jgi:hypothetical protein